MNPNPPAEKVNGFAENTAAVPPRQTVAAKKSTNPSELSSEQDLYNQTKVSVGE